VRNRCAKTDLGRVSRTRRLVPAVLFKSIVAGEEGIEPSLARVKQCAALPMSYTPVPAGGIEPPHDGATTRCLPTWLSRRNLVAEAGFEPAADGAYETPALPTELFRA
jgi:hypothetical protein